MIGKIDQMSEYPSAPTKMILDADWDVLYALFTEMRRFKIRPTMEHVSSHQDDNKEKTDFTIAEEMNIAADGLATQGLRSLFPKQRVPMDPLCVAQVHIGGETVDQWFMKRTGELTVKRRLKQTLREIIHLPDLKKYQCRRFSWSEK